MEKEETRRNRTIGEEYTLSYKNPVIQIIGIFILGWLVPPFLPNSIGTIIQKGLYIVGILLIGYWTYVLIKKYTPIGKMLK